MPHKQLNTKPTKRGNPYRTPPRYAVGELLSTPQADRLLLLSITDRKNYYAYNFLNLDTGEHTSISTWIMDNTHALRTPTLPTQEEEVGRGRYPGG